MLSAASCSPGELRPLPLATLPLSTGSPDLRRLRTGRQAMHLAVLCSLAAAPPPHPIERHLQEVGGLTPCQTCCTPGGSCEQAYKGTRGQCCGTDGSTAYCCPWPPTEAMCVKCNVGFQCARAGSAHSWADLNRICSGHGGAPGGRSGHSTARGNDIMSSLFGVPLKQQCVALSAGSVCPCGGCTNVTRGFLIPPSSCMVPTPFLPSRTSAALVFLGVIAFLIYRCCMMAQQQQQPMHSVQMGPQGAPPPYGASYGPGYGGGYGGGYPAQTGCTRACSQSVPATHPCAKNRLRAHRAHQGCSHCRARGPECDAQTVAVP